MLFEPKNLEEIIKLFDKLCKTINIKSAGGRVLLGMEVFMGLFLIIVLFMTHAETLFEAIYAWLRGKDFTFHHNKYPELAMIMMFISVCFVAVRENIKR